MMRVDTVYLNGKVWPGQQRSATSTSIISPPWRGGWSRRVLWDGR